MNLNDLIDEYRTVGFGPLIYHEVSAVASSVVWSYDPIVYGGVWSWDEGVDDLVQEFCLDVLVQQGQLDYALLVAADGRHFRRLLARQVRHHLARRRSRTIVDNLLDRSKEITSSSPFEIQIHRRGWSFTLEGRQFDSTVAGPVDLADLASRLEAFPRIRSNPVMRAPMVYTTETLGGLLRAVAEWSPGWVSVTDLHGVFSALLTSWLPSFLENSEGEANTADVRVLDGEELRIAEEAVDKITLACSASQLDLLEYKLDGTSDSRIAARRGVSRPTVMKQKNEVLRILREVLANVSDRVRLEVMDRLGSRLGERKGQRW